MSLDYLQQGQGYHELEILGPGLETAESGFAWDKCKKYPGHEQFIAVKDFKDKYNRLFWNKEQRQMLGACIDLTVKLRVRWTSSGRPDDDQLSKFRGTAVSRLGTGFIFHVRKREFKEQISCEECKVNGMNGHWFIFLQTAHHVVYDHEEAKKTSVDLFYDSETSTPTTLQAGIVNFCDSVNDYGELLCVTHDEKLAHFLQQRLADLQPCKDMECLPSERCVLIISHPHGQPKRITVGKEIRKNDRRGPLDEHSLKYLTPTCPGSSGAPILGIASDRWFIHRTTFGSVLRQVHSGTCVEKSKESDHINFSQAIHLHYF